MIFLQSTFRGELTQLWEPISSWEFQFHALCKWFPVKLQHYDRFWDGPGGPHFQWRNQILSAGHPKTPWNSIGKPGSWIDTKHVQKLHHTCYKPNQTKGPGKSRGRDASTEPWALGMFVGCLTARSFRWCFCPILWDLTAEKNLRIHPYLKGQSI